MGGGAVRNLRVTITLDIDFTRNGGWSADDEPVVRAAAEAAIAGADLEADDGEEPPSGYALSVLMTDDATVRALNRDWRGKDSATNVLSFPAEMPPIPGEPDFLGDIALAHETMEREATLDGKALDDHLRHLVVHGVLHLLGYDHIEKAEAEEMEMTETRILAGLGVPDPYAGSDVLEDDNAADDMVTDNGASEELPKDASGSVRASGGRS